MIFSLRAGEIDRKSLRIYKANLRFAHDKFTQFEMDILFELIKLPANKAIRFPPFMSLLIKRLFDAGYVVARKYALSNADIDGMPLNPIALILTSKGRLFIESLSLDVYSKMLSLLSTID